MPRSTYVGKLLLAVGIASLASAAPVKATEFPFIFEPTLSLTGDCQLPGAPVDPIPDPGCPGGTHPPSGRFSEPRSVAIDSYGNEYVASYAFDGTKGRIDVFNDEGIFVTELLNPRGPKTIAVDSKGNLYVFERLPGKLTEIVRYSPTAYKPETGDIKYEDPPHLVATSENSEGGLAVDISNDHLFASVEGFVGEYGSAVEGNKLLKQIIRGKWVAIDAQRRRLYTSSCEIGESECDILVLEADAPYGLLETIDGSTTPVGNFLSKNGLTSIAVDEETGHFFIDDLEVNPRRVYEFGEDYEYVSTLEDENFQGGNPLQIAVSNAPLNPTARNRHYLFVPVLLAAGRVLAYEPPIVTDPVIESLKAVNIAETEAEIKATIDPNGGDTEYTIEVEGPGIEGSEVVSHAMIPGSGLPKTVGGLVGGLEPGQTYSVRAFTENEAGEDEEDAIFATFSDSTGTDSCANQALRTGPSAALPDCRAHELVTPANTNGRPVRGAGFEGDRFGMVQSSPAGEDVSFELTGGILPGTEGTGGFHGDPYRAARDTSGWSTILTGPSGTEASKPRPGSASPDQGYSFWVAGGEGTAVLNETEARYVRYADGHSELVGRGSLGSDPGASGRLITAGGTHIVFQTGTAASAVQLEPSAPSGSIKAVYDRTADEVTHVVSLLPGDVTPTKDSTYRGSSSDGSGIAFENEGTLYLRLNNTITFQIGNKGAVFAGVSEEGKRAFYLEGGDLKAFDTAEEKVINFTDVGDAIPVNVAPQGNRAYFVSEKAIGGSGSNPNGAEPQAGEQNLYLSEEGAISFVGTVTDRDVKGIESASGKIDGLGLWIQAVGLRPATDPSRLTPDGSVFLFQSRANLDGYDSGEFAQIYRYDSGANSLRCLSCPPTKLPATGGASLQSFSITDLAAPFSQYGFVPNIRADGKRIFFESTEALVSSDTDEVRDVYEWEEEGVGSCAREGGCIYLISSGHSARNNYLFGHSASGDDVFFTTGDVLVGGDEDTPSVYDARVNGGVPALQKEICLDEDECKPPLTPPPSLTAPANLGSTDSGNGPPPKSSKRCPRGTHRVKRHGRTVCARNKRHKRHSRSGAKGN